MESFDLASLVLRAASYYAVLRTTGVALAPLWARALGDREGCGLDLSPGHSALSATGLILAHRVLDSARLAGEWAGLGDIRLESMVWLSPAGTASLATAAGLLLIAGSDMGPARLRRALALIGCLLSVIGFALTGHTNQPGVAPLARILVPLHLALLAFWLGGIIALSRAARSEDSAVATTLACAFSAAAIWLVPVIAVAGLLIAFLLLPDISYLREPYGLGLLGKSSTFLALIALAAYNRLLLLPRLAADVPGARRGFARSLRAEHLLLVAALTITAGITTIWGLHGD